MDSFRLTIRPLLIVTTATLVLVSGTRGSPLALAGNEKVEVNQEQAVTVVGVFPSLKSVIAQVCRHGGVELRAFDARDREVTVSYHGVPLTTALEGLLREESYLVGVTASDPGKPPRVAWLRVVGGSDIGLERPPPGEAGSESSAPRPTMGFEVPATFGNAEFSSEDPEQRARALHAIASRLVTTKGVMSADPRALAAALRDYPHARQLVTQLRDEQEDPDVRTRLDQVLAALP